MTPGHDFRVDPVKLLRVAHERADGSTAVVIALSCAFVSVRQEDGTHGIAVEIVFDPAIQPPCEVPRDPYCCSLDQLRQRQFPPKALSMVWPITEPDQVTEQEPS